MRNFEVVEHCKLTCGQVILILLTVGIQALRSSKPVPRCTAVRTEGGGPWTEESEVTGRWAGYFERLYQTDAPAVEFNIKGVTTLLLTLQSTVIHLRLWKHRLW